MNRSLFAVLSAIFALFVLVPGASAAVTLGSALAETANDGIACPSTCTVVQSALPSGAVVAPFDGVIVRWRIRTDGPGGPFQLRVAKPFTGDSRVGAGWSAVQTTTSVGVSEFSTRLPIRTGDNIGLDFTSSNTAKFKHGVGVPGATSLYFVPLLPDGVETAPDTVNTNTEMMYNADVEPDADRDGFGDETQDRCPGVFGPAEGCDKTAPKLEVIYGGPQSVGRLRISVLADEAALVTARPKVTYRSKGKKITLTGKLTKLSYSTLGASKVMRLNFSKKQRSAIRAQLKRGRKLSASVNVTAKDPSGNAVTAKIKIRLT